MSWFWLRLFRCFCATLFELLEPKTSGNPMYCTCLQYITQLPRLSEGDSGQLFITDGHIVPRRLHGWSRVCFWRLFNSSKMVLIYGTDSNPTAIYRAKCAVIYAKSETTTVKSLKECSKQLSKHAPTCFISATCGIVSHQPGRLLRPLSWNLSRIPGVLERLGIMNLICLGI